MHSTVHEVKFSKRPLTTKSLGEKLELVFLSDALVVLSVTKKQSFYMVYPPVDLTNISAREYTSTSTLKNLLEIKLSKFILLLIQAPSQEIRIKLFNELNRLTGKQSKLFIILISGPNLID
jgi:hypothetical protein